MSGRPIGEASRVLAAIAAATMASALTAGCVTSANPLTAEPVPLMEQVQTITGVGYAVVSTQAGRTDAQKRLMAIRAARMSAMRDLAEQIHGLRVESNTTVVDMMLQNDTFRSTVQGVIRGARTVRINPTGDDIYETVLEIDADTVARMLQAAAARNVAQRF